jgi:hypothetical protein
VEYAHGLAPGSHLTYWLVDTLPGTCDASGNNCQPDLAGLEQALDVAANEASVQPAQPHTPSTRDPLRAPATPVTIPGLVIHVAALAHGRLAAHGTIAVSVKTRSHALVNITAAVTAQRVVSTGMGSKHKAKLQTVVLARRTIHVRANARGQVRANMRLAYAPRTVVPGLLTVTVRTSWGVARRSQRVTVLPLPHRKPS